MLDSSTLSKESNKKDKVKEIPSYKILIIGDLGTGKTSLNHRYIYNKFLDENKQTVGFDFEEKNVQVSPKDKINLIIWDTVGSEKFHSIAHNLFTKCDGIILCFDISNSKNFENLDNWINYINEYVDIKDNGKKKDKEEEEEEEEEEEKEWIDDEEFKPILVLAGTKSDLRKENHVTIEKIRELCMTLKCEYFETSAKNGNGVDDLFFYMAKELFDKKIVIDKNKKGFKLGKEKYDKDQSRSKGCC